MPQEFLVFEASFQKVLEKLQSLKLQINRINNFGVI